MNIVTIKFETESVYSEDDIAGALDAFRDFISEVDDDANLKSVSVTAMSEVETERQKQADFFEALNSSNITATMSIELPNAPEYSVELTSEGENGN